MLDIAKPMLKNQYGQYLMKVVDEMDRTKNRISINMEFIKTGLDDVTIIKPKIFTDSRGYFF